MAAMWTDPPSGDAPAAGVEAASAGTEPAHEPATGDQRGPDIPAAVELDRMEADLSRVSESLRLLDQEGVEPARATAWLTEADADAEAAADDAEAGADDPGGD